MTKTLRTFPLLSLALCAATAQSPSLADLERAFAAPPDDARVMMRWWWFGPSVTHAQLARELLRMKEGGLGGVEIQPVYPLALDDRKTGIRNLPYLSPEFLAALRFTSEEAARLGLRVDVTLGSGWPYGGPHIPIAQAAGRLRVDRVRADDATRRIPAPDTGAGETLLAAYFVPATGAPREITDVHDGAYWLPPTLKAPGEVQFFIAGRTGMMVKRASVGAEGFVLDHYDRAALDNHLKTVGEPLLSAFGNRPPYAVFCDSLEVFGSDWTADFLEQFRRRRGYDLKPHLPALAGGRDAASPALRGDWGRTLTELAEERFLAPLRQWANQHGAKLRIQGYGMPPAAISSFRFADLPEGEGPQWKILRASRWASSGSHLYGHNITSSETWTWIHSPVFSATPLDVKAEADLHFLQGINQLIGHGWPYTPEGVDYPGWRFYAAGVFDEKNPWWIVMPDLALYLQRVSFLLRQGRPANDVAFYLPNADGWAHMTPGRVDLLRTLEGLLGRDVVARVLESGFNFDFFDDGALAELGRVEGGALVMGGNRYRIVVLPAVERIPAATLQTLEAFARGGGTLVATRRLPALAPGFLATPEDHRRIRETAQRLFQGPQAPGRFVAHENQGLDKALAARLRPDLSLTPAAPAIGFVHRSAGNAEIYFVANSANIPWSGQATFRVEGLHAELWDPFTGKVTPAGNGATVALDLEPYGSRVIVFSKRTPAAPPAPARLAAGAIDLSSGWTVTFGPHAKPVAMDQLQSWTANEQTRYFSGTAVYERDFEVPIPPGVELRLDFGEAKPIPEEKLRNGMRAWLDAPVREAAVVYVNGARAGSVWSPPYSLDITGFLRRGRNHLRIEVANLALNHMAGRSQPNYRLLNLRYGVRFEPQDMDQVKPMPSGLLGPIRLLVERAR